MRYLILIAFVVAAIFIAGCSDAPLPKATDVSFGLVSQEVDFLENEMNRRDEHIATLEGKIAILEKTNAGLALGMGEAQQKLEETRAAASKAIEDAKKAASEKVEQQVSKAPIHY